MKKHFGKLLWSPFALYCIHYAIQKLPVKSLERIIESTSQLLLMVALAAFVSTIIEEKAWHRFIRFISKPLLRFGRLPDVCGTAFTIAFFSSNAANTMLVESHQKGNLSYRDLVTGALCNSWAIMISHYVRIMIPFITAAGIAGAYYYGITFGIGILMVVGFLSFSRIKNKGLAQSNIELPQGTERKEKPWQKILQMGLKRSWNTALRILFITIPLYFFVAALNKQGYFKVTTEQFPHWISQYFSVEMMAVIGARLAGLISSAGVASELLQTNTLNTTQVVIAFLFGNMITNPIRSLRRNLPTALGIFPGKTGAKIVLILQSLRFVLALLAIVVLLAFQ